MKKVTNGVKGGTLRSIPRLSPRPSYVTWREMAPQAGTSTSELLNSAAQCRHRAAGTAGWDTTLQLDPNEINVWRIHLDEHAVETARLSRTLSQEENERMARFGSPELQNRWTVTRGALRCILASYLHTQPKLLSFTTGPHGKPQLSQPWQHIRFNLSHTANLAFLAVADGMEVGIDAELMSPAIDLELISRRFFSPAEAACILALPSTQRLAAFYNCWTRKEAFLKASGHGLTVHLNTFSVSVRPGQPVRLISVEWDDPARWTLLDLGEPNLALCLAAELPSHVPVRLLEFRLGGNRLCPLDPLTPYAALATEKNR